MSDAEAYLRELRRSLPVGCRRRFVAEVREHFASAIAAEAKRGVARSDAERLTIDRLGPASALAEQLLGDLRSGALGRVGRLAAGLTTTRLIALATVSAVAVMGVVLIGVRSSSTPPTPQPTAVPLRRVVLMRTDVGAVLARVQANVNVRTGEMQPRQVRFPCAECGPRGRPLSDPGAERT